MIDIDLSRLASLMIDCESTLLKKKKKIVADKKVKGLLNFVWSC